MANFQIAVINEYALLTDAVVQAAVNALQKQVHAHFAPAWGIDADLTYYPKGKTPPLTAWQLVILDNSDQAGALGYHDVTNTGYPIGKVFAGTDAQYGSSWTVTASHELLEMLGDPDINLTVFRESKDGSSGTLYAYETCDACEDDSFGYKIDGVLLSDFVFPEWFEDFHPAGTKYDYQGKIAAAFQLIKGGYIGIYKINSGAGWTQLTDEKTSLLYKMRANIGSRRERRRTPRDQWLRSTVRSAGKSSKKKST
jgi:hypothetical protein